MSEYKGIEEVPKSRGYKRQPGQCFFCEAVVWTKEEGFQKDVERIVLGFNNDTEATITVCASHKRIRVDQMTKSITRRIIQGWASELERRENRKAADSYWFCEHNGVCFKDVEVTGEIERRVPMASDPFTTTSKVPLTS